MRRKGRTYISTRFGRCPSAALISQLSHLLTLAPAFLFSCSAETLPAEKPGKTQIYIHKTAKTTAGPLDLFFFNEDALLTLDAYQRFEPVTDAPLDGASRTGNKLIAGVMNLPGDIWAWSDINTFQRLSERTADLTEDSPGRPFMTGTARLCAGKDRQCTLELTPLMSQIVLESLCFDFHARPYRDLIAEDIDIYLVNVNRTAALFDDGSATLPASWLNMGGLDVGSVPAGHLDRAEGTIFPGTVMYCYPNSATEDCLGRPLTRLVIEATLGGQRYWYPVNLRGIGRNQVLKLNITITRTGSSGPDIPTEAGTVQCEGSIVPWHSTTPQTITF